jgi:MSHA biogenesis protein MshP
MSRHSIANRLAMRQQRGVSIITAIFLLLLFAALAAYMVSMKNTADVTSAQDVQGERAYHAAQAGLEWGAYQILVPAGAVCAVLTTLPAPVSDFTVTVTCTASGPFNEAGNTFSVYRLTSRARNAAAAGSAAFVEREVYGSVSR